MTMPGSVWTPALISMTASPEAPVASTAAWMVVKSQPLPHTVWLAGGGVEVGGMGVVVEIGVAVAFGVEVTVGGMGVSVGREVAGCVGVSIGCTDPSPDVGTAVGGPPVQFANVNNMTVASVTAGLHPISAPKESASMSSLLLKRSQVAGCLRRYLNHRPDLSSLVR